MKHNGYTQDCDGNKSSKRLMGLTFGVIAVFMGIIGWAVALFQPVGSEKIILEMPAIFGGICFGLLTGGTLAESLKKMPSRIKSLVKSVRADK